MYRVIFRIDYIDASAVCSCKYKGISLRQTEDNVIAQ